MNAVSLRVRVAMAATTAAVLVVLTFGVAYVLLLRSLGAGQIRRALEPSRDPAGAVDHTIAVNTPVIDALLERNVTIGVAVGLAGVLASAALGWLLAGPVAHPLNTLARAARRIGSPDDRHLLSASGSLEAIQISDAMRTMLERIDDAHTETRLALSAARDFAAASAHELRSPLTAMRTDLEVLATRPVDEAMRTAIARDLLLTQRHLEGVLSSLEKLALGELTSADDFERFDVMEVVHQAIESARTRHPTVRMECRGAPSAEVTGLPSGFRLVVGNAIDNAVRHGEAGRVVVEVTRDGPELRLIIDDDGAGVPDEIRSVAFERFTKGPGSSGLGLGLALIAQQARLHGGTAILTDSPLGGTRLQMVARPAMTPEAR